MKKVNKILVACDLSNYSIQAVEYAADMAESVNAELVIVNVINQRDLDMIEKVTQHTDEITVSKYVSETREYRSEEIAKVLADAKRHPALYRTNFRTGVPFREILAAIEEENEERQFDQKPKPVSANRRYTASPFKGYSLHSDRLSRQR